jgi:hypothetical protein
MKMHPKPMARHTQCVKPCLATIEPVHVMHEVHIILTLDDKTQRVCMTALEAQRMIQNIKKALNDLVDG